MFSNIRKALITAVGLVLTLLTAVHDISSFLPASVNVPVAAVIAILTTIATYLVPNSPPTTPPAAS